MVLYDQNRNAVNYPVEKGRYLASGNFGDVFIFNDIVLKIFTCIQNEEERQAILEILSTLKQYNFNNIYEVFDFYFDQKDKFKGYTSKYYQSDASVDILTMPKDFFLDNYFSLVKDFQKLHQIGIKPRDISACNSIINNEKIMIIDADLFCLENYPLNEAFSELHGLFSELSGEAVLSFHQKEFENHWDIYYLIWTLLESGQLFEELKQHKYLIDCVRKRVR